MLSFKQHLNEQQYRYFDQTVINAILAAWGNNSRNHDFPSELDYNQDGVIDEADLRYAMEMMELGDVPWYPAGQHPEGGGERSANGGGRNKLQGRANPVALGPRHPPVHK